MDWSYNIWKFPELENVTLYRYVYKKGEVIVEKHKAEYYSTTSVAGSYYIVRKYVGGPEKYRIKAKKIDTVYQAAGMYIMWSLTDNYDTQLKFINKLYEFVINKEKKICDEMKKLDKKVEVIGNELFHMMIAKGKLKK